ncbi:MAG TPA: NYN domain-containing protein, partial [Ktedonobacteraceae bacterium]|nr:NYN domain-containing protein [Ktedonobacteraceae bacterium]
MPEEIALFIDFENIRYSMLNIQRREPDPQELIAVARRYGTVMVARAYADWSRQPEPFKGSLTAAMIDRVDCPAKQRDRIRMGTVHYPGNPPTGALGSSMVASEQGTGSLTPTPYQRRWPSGPLSNSGPLPAIPAQGVGNEWAPYQDAPEPGQPEIDESLLSEDETLADEAYHLPEYQQRDLSRQNAPYQNPYGQSAPTGPLGLSSSTGPLGYTTPTPGQSTGSTGHIPAITASGTSTIVQSTVVQSTVDLNM